MHTSHTRAFYSPSDLLPQGCNGI